MRLAIRGGGEAELMDSGEQYTQSVQGPVWGRTKELRLFFTCEAVKRAGYTGGAIVGRGVCWYGYRCRESFAAVASKTLLCPPFLKRTGSYICFFFFFFLLSPLLLPGTVSSTPRPYASTWVAFVCEPYLVCERFFCLWDVCRGGT